MSRDIYFFKVLTDNAYSSFIIISPSLQKSTEDY